jgi:gamma-glutamyltranspeptidase/glutathione hydrolase
MNLLKRAAAVALFVFCLVAQARDAVTARSYIVAAAHPLAVEAGDAVLAAGGSALDAAIAVQTVLGLVEPQASGIGGGAFMLYWSAKEKTLRSYDGRETAPAAARADRFLDVDKKPLDLVDAIVGGRSVGVPGTLRMLELAHARHGRLPWSELFRYAVSLAEEGFAMPPRLHSALERERYLQENAEARKLYYDPAGRPKPLGSRIVNPDYGATLRIVAREGAQAFYSGPIAADIVKAVRSHAKPGDLALEDLAAYRALEREPVCGPYRRWRLCSMPPPSSGGIAVLQILGVLERVAFAKARPDSTDAAHLFAEAGRLAYADRARYIGDPDFVSVPLDFLLSPEYLKKQAALIGQRARRVAPAGQNEAPGTSHFAIADAEGNVVSMTTSIESPFGSRIMVRGFLLNNELTDFDFKPGSKNEAGPRKRPRSSMAPTIVFAPDGSVRLAVGSAGGSFIINFVAKTLVAALDWDLDIQAAIASPNFGNRTGPTEIELGTSYEPLAASLAERGHAVAIREMTSGLQGIERVPGGWRGGADPRRDGVAKGD